MKAVAGQQSNRDQHFALRNLCSSSTSSRISLGSWDSSPHVVPVGFRVDADSGAIEVGGHGLSRSKKWRDLPANPKVALVIDDLAKHTTVDSVGRQNSIWVMRLALWAHTAKLVLTCGLSLDGHGSSMYQRQSRVGCAVKKLQTQ